MSEEHPNEEFVRAVLKTKVGWYASGHIVKEAFEGLISLPAQLGDLMLENFDEHMSDKPEELRETLREIIIVMRDLRLELDRRLDPLSEQAREAAVQAIQEHIRNL